MGVSLPGLSCHQRFGNAGALVQSVARLSPAAGLEQHRSFCSFPVSFISHDGEETEVMAKPGQTILDVAFEHDIDIEGACGGETACSTCHVIFDQAAYNAMPEPDDNELDVLELALGVTDTSRLGCQVKLQKDRDTNLKIILPETTASVEELRSPREAHPWRSP